MTPGPCFNWGADDRCPRERNLLAHPLYSVHHARYCPRRPQLSFLTDIERLAAGYRGWVSLDVVKSTNTHALLRGAVPKGAHTSRDSGLARYLEDGFVADKGIHLDLTVSIDT